MKIPTYAEYKDSLVAFIDLLGFDQSVSAIKTQKDFDEVAKLMTLLQKLAGSVSSDDGVFKIFSILTVSDSIIITVPFNDKIATYGMLSILHKFQYELLATEFKRLVRGYINRGYVYHKDGMIFGAGYSNAYKGESKIGGAPRIVVSHDLIRDAGTIVNQNQNTDLKKTIFDLVVEDLSDGFWYIDFFKPVSSLGMIPHHQALSERSLVKQFIDSCLIKYENDISIYPKYKWLSNYYEYSKDYFIL